MEVILTQFLSGILMDGILCNTHNCPQKGCNNQKNHQCCSKTNMYRA